MFSSATRPVLIALTIILVLAAAATVLWFSVQEKMPPPIQPALTKAVDSAFSPAALASFSLTGTISATDGTPIPGALVTLTLQTNPVINRSLNANDQGVYLFEDLPPATVRLDATAQGFISPGPPDQAGIELVVSPDSLLGQNTPPLVLDFTLQRPATLGGLITASGAPIAGATISLLYAKVPGPDGPIGPFDLLDEATTNDQGVYALDAISPGELRLQIQAKGFALTQSREILLRQGEARQGFDIDLRPSGTLQIQITSTQGDPLAAEVLLSSPSLPQPRRVRKPDADKSALEITALPAGPITLTTTAPNFRTAITQADIVAGELTSVDVILERADGLFGTVSPLGDHLDHSAILLTTNDGASRRLRPDALGHFSLILSDQDAQKQWSAQALSPAHQPSQKVPLTPGTSASLTMAPGSFIQGKVTQSGQPLSSFTLSVSDFEPAPPSTPRAFGPSAWPPRPFRRTDGTFSLGPLAPGTYYLRAAATGWADAISTPIIVQPGRPTSGIDIRMQAGGQAKGQVLEASTSAPIAGATVELFDPLSLGSRIAVTTNAQGEYNLTGITPGRRSVRVSKQGYTTQVAAGLEIAPGQTQTRHITLEATTKEGGQAFSFQGIGAVLAQNDEGVILQKLMPGSPAETFGLKEGDLIRGVDGKDATSMRLAEVINMIRGEEGVPVSLEIVRPDQGVLTIDVERGQIKAPE